MNKELSQAMFKELHQIIAKNSGWMSYEEFQYMIERLNDMKNWIALITDTGVRES